MKFLRLTTILAILLPFAVTGCSKNQQIAPLESATEAPEPPKTENQETIAIPEDHETIDDAEVEQGSKTAEDPFDALYATFRGKLDGEHRYHDELHEAAFQKLIHSGADINVRNEEGMTLLMVAYTDDVMDALIKAGIDVNARDKDGKTALMHLVNSHHPWNVDILIKAGADVNAKDNHGRTPLMHIGTVKSDRPIALEYSEENDAEYTEIIKKLIKAGAIVNASDDSGKTPLMNALPAEAVRYLIKAGAKVNAQDNHGRTPLMYVIHPESVNYLVKAGAKINAKDNDGKTPLMHTDDPDIIKALIAAGANVNAKDNDGVQAFVYAYVSQFPSDAGPFYHEYDPQSVYEMFKKARANVRDTKSLLKLVKSACSSHQCRNQCVDDDCIDKCYADCDESECDTYLKNCFIGCEEKNNCSQKCPPSNFFDKMTFDDHDYYDICESLEDSSEFTEILQQTSEPEMPTESGSTRKSKMDH